jgi:UDP-glucose 4-epimerase
MSDKQRILITGGAGYIGSHVSVELIAAGFDIVVYDNFENAAAGVPGRVSHISKTDFPVIKGDVSDKDLISATLKEHRPDLVMHLAGKKAVGESVEDPLMYYRANLGGGISLIEAMQENGVGKLIFSSSATVYAFGDGKPLDETSPVRPSNPYGQTKLMLEDIISDVVAAGKLTDAVSLRYFNPVGAHSSGLIGEAPSGAPNNLFPFIAQTAAGLRKLVQVFGDDYDTTDGTGVRDYIHVVDLARGHLAAAKYLLTNETHGQHQRVNLGTGTGYSVMQALKAFSTACGFEIPYEIVGRRPGDIASCVADPERAAQMLNWWAEYSLDRMCSDHWAFQSKIGKNRS